MTKKDKVEQKVKIREQNELFRRLLEEAYTELQFNYTALANRIRDALRKP